MKLGTVCAYIYKADIYCPGCIPYILTANPVFQELPTEEILHRMALDFGIDRLDENTFDSDEFPKVVFGDFLTKDDSCARCGEQL